MAWIRFDREDGTWFSLDSDHISMVNHSLEFSKGIHDAILTMDNGKAYHLTLDEWKRLNRIMNEERMLEEDQNEQTKMERS